MEKKLPFVSLIIIISLSILQSKSTQIDRYDLAIELYDHGMANISTWMCIIGQASDYHYDIGNGLFAFNTYNWCLEDIEGNKCNMKCSEFRNRNLTDDIYCAKKIFNARDETFAEWRNYAAICAQKIKNNIQI